MEKPLEEIVYSKNQENSADKRRVAPKYCRRCEYEFACFRRMPEETIFKTPDGEPGLNYLCSGWKMFFSHIDERIEKIVRRIGYPVIKKTCALAVWNLETYEGMITGMSGYRTLDTKMCKSE